MVFSDVVAGVFSDFKQELLRLYNDFTGTEQHSSSSSDMIASSMTLPDQTPPEPCGTNDESKSVISAEKVEQSDPKEVTTVSETKEQVKEEEKGIRALGKWKVYTDGSYSQYDDNGGYGVYFGYNDPRNISGYLDYCDDSFEAEVRAIQAAVNAIYGEISKLRENGGGKINKYLILSDSQSAIRAIIKMCPSYDYVMDVNEIYHAIREFYFDHSEIFSGHVFNIHWVRGHSGNFGNVMADSLATRGRLSCGNHKS
ncbi:CYFA0S01e19834g1_1 [Cyberlindnera fabianii]|uniref:ribonuclease H n=1 Tax=Cyberlindnera fabianii TaxID=36022 RepID=A0A061ARN4_CYBFA|nr:CYFA0S01e19834g1_1 [Cyberlindnera fabianii]